MSLQLVYLLRSFVVIFSVWLIRKIIKLREVLHSINHLAGYRDLFAPSSAIGIFGPRIPHLASSSTVLFENKHTPFADAGSDIISLVYALPTPTATVIVADADIIKEITTSRARFPKPVDSYRALAMYGNNIVASGGDEWRRMRRISAPAFSERNNKLVWDETIRIIDNLHHEVWKSKEVISIDNCVDVTFQIALFVIAAAGFGRRISWPEGEDVLPPHTMSFKRALQLMCTDLIFKIILPESALNLTQRTQNVKVAFHELRSYMLEMIAEHQSPDVVGQHDLLSSLMDANCEEEEVLRLTDMELMGNIFIFLLAGHETTAHTLSYALALLALYPDEQQKLYEHIKSVIPHGRTPSYEDMPKLVYTMAVFNEALRMFSPVVSIPKRSAEDTVFTTKNERGDSITVPVPKGMRLVISTPGLHYNPRYWKDPYKFDPSRFLRDWPRNAFMPFSAGPRGCLGRRFAETEAVAALTVMISRYRVTVTEEVQHLGETFDQTKERLLRSRSRLTLRPIRVPLTFTRRQ